MLIILRKRQYVGELTFIIFTNGMKPRNPILPSNQGLFNFIANWISVCSDKIVIGILIELVLIRKHVFA